MASWFASTTGVDLSSAFGTLTETVQNVTESVQDAIPAEHKAMLAKLTLNTDEMISERKNFREEATRKEDAKDRLNKILPWETLDAEREVRDMFFFNGLFCFALFVSFADGMESETSVFFLNLDFFTCCSLRRRSRFWWKNAKKLSWS